MTELFTALVQVVAGLGFILLCWLLFRAASRG